MIVDGIDYFEELLRIIKSYKNLYYITYNKTAGSLEASFKDKKIYFVDAITSRITKAEERENCIFVDNPADFKKILTGLTGFVKNGAGLIILDKISNIPTYLGSNEKLKSFITYLIQLSDKSKQDIMIICDKKDEEKILIPAILSLFDNFKIIRE